MLGLSFSRRSRKTMKASFDFLFQGKHLGGAPGDVSLRSVSPGFRFESLVAQGIDRFGDG